MRRHWKPLIASLISFCAITVVVLSICSPCQGQTGDATLGGVIEDRSGAVIPQVAIKVTSVETGVTRNATTNGSGLFSVPGLNPGRYSVHVEHPGFADVEVKDITLNVGSNRQLEIKLAVGKSEQSVTVDGSGLNINTTDGSVSTVINRKFVENIPLNGRSFQDLISMTPGVVTQSPQTTEQAVGYQGDFSVNGQRTESNYYMVDGVSGNTGAGAGYGTPQSATAGTIAASTSLGTTQSLVSVDALQEFRVQGSTYSAEFGRTPGGQFSLATRSGTNDVHGTAFDYLRNNVFDANDWFNDHYGDPEPALRQNDFGGTLGGPVLIPRLYDGRNRTFFFVSYEGLRLDQPTAAVIQYVPDAALRSSAPAALQPILNAFPSPTQNAVDYIGSGLAQFISPYSLPSQIDSTSVRFDETIGPKLSVFFRFADTPSSTETRTLSVLTKESMNTTTYTFGATSPLTAKLLNEFRLGYARANSSTTSTLDSFGGATPIDLAAAVGLGGYSNPYAIFDMYIVGVGDSNILTERAANLSRQWNLTDNLSFQMGHQQIKVGVDYRHIKSPVIPTSPYLDAEFESEDSVLANSVDYGDTQKAVSATPIFVETAFFVQDEWRIKPRLAISLGARYEIDPAPTEQHGNDAYTLSGSLSSPSTLALAPQGTSLWKTSWYNLAPRIGVAWTANAHAKAETVVRGGAGVFFDTDNQYATYAYDGIGFGAYTTTSGFALPILPSQLDFSTAPSAPYIDDIAYAFPRHLQLPYTLEWNVSLQQAMGSSQALTVSYVGSNGRRLIQEQELAVQTLNPNFGTVVYFNTGSTSNYQALQTQFQRNMNHGLQALVSYTWSHSLDDGSTGNQFALTRGNSNFDVRNNFSGGLSWDLPSVGGPKFTKALLNRWGLDGRLTARSGFPIPLLGNLNTDPATGTRDYSGVNLVPNEPLWLYGSQYSGGRVINKAAFSLPATGLSGDAPRNFVRGFGETQINLAARREITLHEGIKLQLRAETFNVLNHPNFGYITPQLTSATFGQATEMLNQSLGSMSSLYQQGGPRSMQFALKLLF